VPKGARQLETYLLARLASCGRCGKPLYVLTGSARRDGTFARRYKCASHIKERGRTQCLAPPIDAHTAEAMVVSSISTLLIGPPERESTINPDEALGRGRMQRRLREAVLSEDERRLAQTLEDLFAAMEPEAALIRDTAISQRQTRELKEAARLRAWIEREADGRTEETREQARELNQLLRKMVLDDRDNGRSAHRRDQCGAPATSERSRATARVRIDRAAWARFAPLTRRSMVRYSRWNDAEIIGALQAWADVHGRSPTSADWARSTAIYPAAPTVCDHFGAFNDAIRAAGLKPEPRRQPERYVLWDDLDVIRALQRWTSEHRRPPTWADWLRAAPEHPSVSTVRAHFGTWDDGLAVAGLSRLPSAVHPPAIEVE
jgi:hypothetical protein